MNTLNEEFQSLANSLKQLKKTYDEVFAVGVKIEYCSAEDVPKWMNSRHRLIARSQELSELIVQYVKSDTWMNTLTQSQQAWVSELRNNIVEMEPAIIQQHHKIIQQIRVKSQQLRGQLIQQNTQNRAINAYNTAPGSRMMAY